MRFEKFQNKINKNKNIITVQVIFLFTGNKKEAIPNLIDLNLKL